MAAVPADQDTQCVCQCLQGSLRVLLADTCEQEAVKLMAVENPCHDASLHLDK